MLSSDLLVLAQRLNAIAQSGLTYCQNAFDQERYEEIRMISLQIMAGLGDAPLESIMKIMPLEAGYQTPKVDIRAVVLNEQNELLMVQEKMDQDRWSLPGGWADVGYTPFEVARKEVLEETGLQVKAVRLLAVHDKKMHGHPPQPWYVYKFFILCQAFAGSLAAETMETSKVSWINRQTLPHLSLSTDRNTLLQLELMFDLALDENIQSICD